MSYLFHEATCCWFANFVNINPLSHILSHFVQVLHVRIYEIKVLRIYMYSGIHTNKYSLVNL